MINMQEGADLIWLDNMFCISGHLTVKNVMALHQQCLAKSANCPDYKFDFSRVSASDSAGLAFVIEWIKLAETQQKKITFINLSNGLMDIALAAGLDQLLKPLISEKA